MPCRIIITTITITSMPMLNLFHLQQRTLAWIHLPPLLVPPSHQPICLKDKRHLLLLSPLVNPPDNLL
jgi:hypothetical protein